jgi:CheY-like chemotaxis protein
MSTRKWSILLVEDDPDDVFFMERALAKAQLDLPMQVAVNGEQAINYLAGNGKYADRIAYPLPSCVFLDLKLPFVNGFEVLEWIRGQPPLAALPVIVLTSSPEERDRQKARQLGAKSYHIKPPTPPMLIEILKSVTDGAPPEEALGSKSKAQS